MSEWQKKVHHFRLFWGTIFMTYRRGSRRPKIPRKWKYLLFLIGLNDSFCESFALEVSIDNFGDASQKSLLFDWTKAWPNFIKRYIRALRSSLGLLVRTPSKRYRIGENPSSIGLLSPPVGWNILNLNFGSVIGRASLHRAAPPRRLVDEIIDQMKKSD